MIKEHKTIQPTKLPYYKNKVYYTKKKVFEALSRRCTEVHKREGLVVNPNSH